MFLSVCGYVNVLVIVFPKLRAHFYNRVHKDILLKNRHNVFRRELQLPNFD